MSAGGKVAAVLLALAAAAFVLIASPDAYGVRAAVAVVVFVVLVLGLLEWAGPPPDREDAPADRYSSVDTTRPRRRR